MGLNKCDCMYDPCKYNPPSPSCQCMQESPSETCGPICADRKPQKTIWQKLFGERKCNVCCKNTSYCVCKKKRSFLPTMGLFNKDSRDSCITPCSDQQNTEKMFNCKRANACPRKGCMPNKRSLLGGHMYFNIENLPKKKICIEPCCCNSSKAIATNEDECDDLNKNANGNSRADRTGRGSSYGGVVDEEPVHDDEAPPPYQKRHSDGYRYTNYSRHSSSHQRRGSNDKRSSTLKSDRRKSTRKECLKGEPNRSKRSTVCFPLERRKSKAFNDCEKKKSSDVIHFGVTLTKSETLLVNPINNNEYETIYSEQRNEISVEGTNLTVCNSGEIKNSNNVAPDTENTSDRDGGQTNKITFDVTSSSFGKGVKSESFAREIEPLLKNRLMGNTNENKNNGHLPQDNCDPENFQQKRQNLDESMCAILMKLQAIENKINRIEKNSRENKITVDLNEQRSSVSFHLGGIKDGKSRKGSNVEKQKSGTTIVKISRSKSITRQPVRCCAVSDATTTNKFQDQNCKSRDHDRRVICCPYRIDEADKCLAPNRDNENFDRQVLWYKISEELKNDHLKRKCYCFDCMCKRERGC